MRTMLVKSIKRGRVVEKVHSSARYHAGEEMEEYKSEGWVNAIEGLAVTKSVANSFNCEGPGKGPGESLCTQGKNRAKIVEAIIR